MTRREIEEANVAFGVMRPAPPLAGPQGQAVPIASFGVSLTDCEILMRFVGANGETGDIAINPLIASRLIQMLTRTARTLEWLDDEGAPIPCSSVVDFQGGGRSARKG